MSSNVDSLAELIETKGSVERDFNYKVDAWQPADVGAHFVVGDGIRVQDNSGAVLELSDGAIAKLTANTCVRFLDSFENNDTGGFDVEKGEVEVIVGNEDMLLQTKFGIAQLKSGSRIVIRKGKKGSVVKVKTGLATFRNKGGETKVVTAGDSIRISIGSAMLTSSLPDEQKRLDAGTNTMAESSDADLDTLDRDGNVSVEVQGKGVLMRSSLGDEWVDLLAGSAELSAQTALKLPQNTTVQIQRNNKKVMLHGAGEFKIGNLGNHLVKTLYGRASFETKDNDLTIIVPGGQIVAKGTEQGGSAVDMDIGKDGTLVRTKKGIAQVIRTGAGAENILAGEQTTIKKISKPKTGLPVPISGGPDYADFGVRAGESFVVHAAKAPVAVEFLFGDKCPQNALVKLNGKNKKSMGIKSAKLLIPRGHSRYQMRCLDEGGNVEKKVVARGKIIVLRDTGKSKLPRGEHTSSIDADGRFYTVYYQHRLPIVNVRWPRAPKSASYELKIKSPQKGATKLTISKANHTFASGDLKEGTHQIVFKSQGPNGRESKQTQFEIRFDNAAPKASLSKPKEGSFGPQETVVVAGLAAPGWKASLSGGEISMDKQQRFSGTVLFTNKYRAVALKLTHPRRSVHYYLRRGKDLVR